ncbi:methylmalonyl Co-A mutase-associated GTPase MeaB [Conexibacter sp. CPCC 206217]|uniref:methylmalonyl Co-A mutase-associated GTPase MeaB n=1 Tax=Conexibacter sp. CPCC 206217 TaxID=3064574 RepID=UPI0027236DB4|nr:methylmalonyl Co-A mutase-associated GTPase MeaB [Conexibacter sp. CPCC 206217]MDO8211123.1 methylmalonyl Co-A mutase-associated GTPase MeaB [Conexibacter sp. CPCC 206217]
MTTEATLSPAALLDAARDGSTRALARALTVLERGEADAEALDRAASAAATGHARTVGLTGPPGAGKSCLVDALSAELCRRGRRVAVLAVDPSSPFSGGALLGDRTRLRADPDPRLFVRSIASRGRLGGLAPMTRAATRLLDAAGFDVVLLETVGVGQSEIEVARVADCVIVVSVPGNGDGVQLAKAGLLETGDLYAVNKSDRDPSAAQQLARALRATVAADVVVCSALREEGTAALCDAAQQQLAVAESSGALRTRRAAAVEHELLELVAADAVAAVQARGDGLREAAAAVAAGRTTTRAAARELLSTS